jgi:hypothetical protein
MYIYATSLAVIICSTFNSTFIYDIYKVSLFTFVYYFHQMTSGWFPNNPMARPRRGRPSHSWIGPTIAMIGLLTMKSVVEGPFHLATIIVADHQLITRVVTINLSGDTMTISPISMGFYENFMGIKCADMALY